MARRSSAPAKPAKSVEEAPADPAAVPVAPVEVPAPEPVVSTPEPEAPTDPVTDPVADETDPLDESDPEAPAEDGDELADSGLTDQLGPDSYIVRMYKVYPRGETILAGVAAAIRLLEHDLVLSTQLSGNETAGVRLVLDHLRDFLPAN